MKLKFLLLFLVLSVVALSAKPVLANKQEPIVWNGCIVASNSTCSGALLGGFGFYYLTPRLTHFTCTNCNIQYASMWSVNLTGSDFTGSDMSNGSLTTANLTDVNFSGVNLTNTMLTNAKLTGNNGLLIDDATFLCHTTMPDGTERFDDCPELAP